MSEIHRLNFNRRALLALVGASALFPRQALARVSLRDLYQARTIVTGMREETRIPGLVRCLADVLVRVSGDQRLVRHALLKELELKPEAPVAQISFRDLYAHRPIKDEQGTRDRPFEMTVEYDPALIDEILARMSSKPWLAERPRLVLFLAVRHIGTSYVLTSTVEAGGLQRESMAAAAWKFGLTVNMPSERTVQQARLTVDSLPGTPLALLEPHVDASVGEMPLAGSLIWNRESLGWLAEWRLEHEGEEHHWSIAGVNFDAAFRFAVGGAAQLLSGNGLPA